MQTFLPYADLAASCRVLDDKRLGKQRVETFQVLRALTWPEYAWKNHPAVRMWRGFVPGLVAYGVASCREWEARGYMDALRPQLLAWTAGEEPRDPELPPWFGTEELHLSHRSNLLRKDPATYRPLFGDDPDDLPYLWPPDVFPQWPLRDGLGLVPHPWQADAVAALDAGRDVLLVARPGSGGTTTGLLAGLDRERTVVVLPPLGSPAGPVPALPPAVRLERDSKASEPIARPPSAADLAAMAAEALPPRFVFRRTSEPGDLLVVDGADPVPLTAAPALVVVPRSDDPAALADKHGLRDPVLLGGGWDVDAWLGEGDLLAQPRPVLALTADRGQQDRLLTRLRGKRLRVESWWPGKRGGDAAVAAWRSRRLDVLLAASLPPLGRVRPASLVALHEPDLETWRDQVEQAGAARAVLATSGRCLREDLLAPFGQPVPYPCGRCDRCVAPTA